MDKSNYITKDLYFASILYALGIKLIGTNKEDGVCWFEFDNYSNCADTYSKYISKELTIDAKSYEEAIRTLKNYLFNEDGFHKE